MPDRSRRKLFGLSLAAGIAPAFVRHAGAADEARFPLGVASGQSRPDSVVLWTRLVGANLPDDVPVQWQPAHDEGFVRIAAQGVETAERNWAHRVHAEPAGLEPARWYWYRFQAPGQRSTVGRTHRARAQRAAAYKAYWEHLPFPKALRPQGPDMRIVQRFDWGALARIHALDDRQYRDAQACPKPGRGGSNTVKLKDCPALLDARRTLLGAEQEAWLAAGWDTQRPWNLLAQQTLMARFSWSDPAQGGTYWTDGWDGYPAARQRLLQGIADRHSRGVVVLSGDVHSHCVANLHADFDDPRSALLATEFCGTSLTSTSLPQQRIDAARPFNPHVQYGRGDQRGYARFTLDSRTLQAQLLALDDVPDPISGVRTAARFAVDPARPGAAAV